MPEYLSYDLGLCAVTATIGILWVRASAAAEDANDETSMVLQLVAWTTLAGPFGSLIAAALIVQRSDAPCRADTVTVQPSELPHLELLQSSLLDHRLRLGRAHAIRPLLDVVIEGTTVEKLDALSLISKRYVPTLAPALKRALEDNDSSVRVLAATVIAQQHNAYTKRIGALQAVARAAPESANDWSELAQAHFDYAASGLLDASHAKAEVSRARAHLAHAAELNLGAAATQTRLDAVQQPSASHGWPTLPVREPADNDECQVTAHAT
jgi:hypothetical protein